MDQMIRLLHHCGLPAEDLDFINCDGKTMNKLLLEVHSQDPVVITNYLSTREGSQISSFSSCLFFIDFEFE